MCVNYRWHCVRSVHATVMNTATSKQTEARSVVGQVQDSACFQEKQISGLPCQGQKKAHPGCHQAGVVSQKVRGHLTTCAPCA